MKEVIKKLRADVYRELCEVSKLTPCDNCPNCSKCHELDRMIDAAMPNAACICPAFEDWKESQDKLQGSLDILDIALSTIVV